MFYYCNFQFQEFDSLFLSIFDKKKSLKQQFQFSKKMLRLSTPSYQLHPDKLPLDTYFVSRNRQNQLSSPTVQWFTSMKSKKKKSKLKCKKSVLFSFFPKSPSQQPCSLHLTSLITDRPSISLFNLLTVSHCIQPLRRWSASSRHSTITVKNYLDIC